MTLFSPYFWIAMLLYGAIAAVGGARLMSHWDSSTIERMKAAEARADKARADEIASNELHALTASRNAERNTQQLETNLAKARADAQTARTKLKEKTSAFITPQADAHVIVPRGFIELWNAAGEGSADQGANPAVAEPAPGTADQPSGVALSTVGGAVEDAGAALKECNAKVRGWQTWRTDVLIPWYNELVKGLQ